MSLADLSPTKALKSFASMMQKYNVNHPGVAKNRCRKNRAKKTPPHRLFMVFSRGPKTTLTTDLQSY
jgi:hypothetical protein